MQCGGGGPVVNRSGDVVGMSFHYDSGISAILSISTAISCVNMWTDFGFVSPVLSKYLYPLLCLMCCM